MIFKKGPSLIQISSSFFYFRWEKCMNQLAGNSNRPHELGNTGQIVLTKCDMGKCDCNQVLVESENQDKPTTKRPTTG